MWVDDKDGNKERALISNDWMLTVVSECPQILQTQTKQGGVGEQQSLSGEQADGHEMGKQDPASLVGSRIGYLTFYGHPQMAHTVN